MENLKNKNSEIKANVEAPQGKTTSSHHKILKHSFFAFICFLLLGILLLVVGSYTTNVSEIWTHIKDIINTKGHSLFDGFGSLSTKYKILHSTAIAGSAILMIDGVIFLWVLFLTIRKIVFK